MCYRCHRPQFWEFVVDDTMDHEIKKCEILWPIATIHDGGHGKSCVYGRISSSAHPFSMSRTSTSITSPSSLAARPYPSHHDKNSGLERLAPVSSNNDHDSSNGWDFVYDTTPPTSLEWHCPSVAELGRTSRGHAPLPLCHATSGIFVRLRLILMRVFVEISLTSKYARAL